MICGLLVHANRNKPIGRMKLPKIMGGSRASGITGFSEFTSSLWKRVLVSTATAMEEKMMPMKIPRNGSEAMPTSHLRTISIE